MRESEKRQTCKKRKTEIVKSEKLRPRKIQSLEKSENLFDREKFGARKLVSHQPVVRMTCGNEMEFLSPNLVHVIGGYFGP